MSFSHFLFDKRIHRAIDTVGYSIPTPIQKDAIPLVLEGHDVLGIAQTGTGKTAAFMLPILQRLLSGPRRLVRALIIAPTRELAEQITQEATDYAKQTGLRCISVYGGVNKNRQIAALKKGAEVVIACPGRLLDHLADRTIDLSRVEVLVLDEADRMCDMGFLPDIRRILKVLPSKRQTLFFSATMPDDIRRLADEILHNPQTVQIGNIMPATTVSHALYPVPGELKKEFFFSLIDNTASARILTFTRTKHRARSLALALHKRGFRASALQGNMSQNQRQNAINGFKDGKYDILIATDIASRGIDITDITHVINYDMPETVDAYTHRIGRTGRALKSGSALTIAVKEDAPMLKDIERKLGEPIERLRLPGFDYGRFVPEEQFADTTRGGGSGNRGGKGGGRSSQGSPQRRPAGAGRKNAESSTQRDPHRQSRKPAHRHQKSYSEKSS